ncbi:MAG: hypothetical protein ACK41C_10430 [Phenylobacterium sp.]|uniref:hypothetical protein n=1 Tax=Phenylobacterium sp. TaxID=1871053 RepID=UPI00391BF6D3
MDAPFPIHPTYTGISVAYKNEEMIADQVLPMATPVSKKEFTYFEIPVAQGLTVPDTRIGRRSEANVIEVTAEEKTAKTEDFALSDLVPNEDVANAPQGYDPLGHATETVTDLLVLGRELRVSNLVFNAATYPAGHKVQLAGSDQWSHADADPFQAIWDKLDIPMMRPNLLVLGQPVWTKIATHPKLIAKLYGSASTVGKARAADLAEALELKNGIIVGKARVNTAKKGQAPNLARAWGKHAAALFINPLANNERGMTFGMTVPKGSRAVRVIPEPKIGIGGSQKVQVEEQLKELIVASNCGYFFEDAVA